MDIRSLDDDDNQTFNIDVPVQGIVEMAKTSTELLAWLEKEQGFFQMVNEKILKQALIRNNQNFGSSTVRNIATSALTQIGSAVAKLEWDKARQLLEAYLNPARSMKRILASGWMGMQIQDNLTQIEAANFHFMLLVYSEDFENVHPEIMREVRSMRALLLVNPFIQNSLNLNSSYHANIGSSAALEHVKNLTESAQQKMSDQTKRMEVLENLYHKKPMIEAPADHWESVLKSKNFQWRLWLFVFVIAIVVPLFGVVYYHSDLINFISQITKESNSGISLSGLTLVSIPTIAYGWILRQISRIYSRSFDLATDAGHRKALSMTFLGLAENEKAKLNDLDRALILEALFRPQPPFLSDDGPPNNILELIKGRAS